MKIIYHIPLFVRELASKLFFKMTCFYNHELIEKNIQKNCTIGNRDKLHTVKNVPKIRLSLTKIKGKF